VDSGKLFFSARVRFGRSRSSKVIDFVTKVTEVSRRCTVVPIEYTGVGQATCSEDGLNIASNSVLSVCGATGACHENVAASTDAMPVYP